jgi:eukaryotic-like serine/threonine-protein kinase
MHLGRVRRGKYEPCPGSNGEPRFHAWAMRCTGRRGYRDDEARSVVGDELLMDRFRLLERIGSGGMGTVYRAFDERLQRDVAVKEVAAADPARVLREAQAAARLNHPGIVTLYELGEWRGSAMLVSELVPGRTLASMHGDGSLSDREVAELGTDLCGALAHAHARGVVHRDVKPQNVVVGAGHGAGPAAKLMDFGIARIAGAPSLTERGEVIGTLAYMAPEQASGELAGPEADAYSLALTLYECWTGENPVVGRTPAETARRIGGELPPLRMARPDLPEGLGETIDGCLESDPRVRPTVAELGECLEAEAGGLDCERALLASSADHPLPDRGASRALRVLGIACLAGALALLAGPGGLPGAALVLAALSLPFLLVGMPVTALAPVAAPVLGAAGLGSAAAALGGCADSIAARAALGAASWAWLLAGSIALGVGPELGIAPPAPDGWAADPGLAAETVLAPLVGLESLLGAASFALAAVALGWLLSLGHASIALLAAMLWAAATDAALSLIGNGALGGRPLGIVLAAALAVAVEFGLLRGGGAVWQGSRARGRSRPLTT